MPDMLVNLLKLPPLERVSAEMEKAAVNIRRAQPFEISKVRAFIEQHFSAAWADEVWVGFSHGPVSVFIATLNGTIVGFGAYECSRRGFFGPTGVMETMQGRGIGKALLLACLSGLRDLGYVYGIIGGVGPVEFYEKAVGAIVIPDSDPGIYVDPLN